MNAEIRDYLASGNPLLYVPTVEYDKAERAVIEAYKAVTEGDAVLARWKSSIGTAIGSLRRGELRQDSKVRELYDAFAYVETVVGQGQSILLICHNAKNFLRDDSTIQALIDATMKAKTAASHIVFLGPALVIEPELSHLVTQVEFPLPSRDELYGFYERLTNECADNLFFDDGAEWGQKGKERERQTILKDASRCAAGLDLFSAENAISLSIARTSKVDHRIIQEVKKQVIAKSDVLTFVSSNESIDTLGGFSELKQWLYIRRDAFTDEAITYGLSFPKGILIAGVSGTGKSLSAKVVASYLKLPLIRMDLGKVFRSYVGESEAAIRRALEQAEAMSPCILHIDEIEKSMAGMKGGGTLDSGVSSRVMATILTWRAETDKPVMMVATANDATSLPPEATRKGRLTFRSQADVKQLKLLETPKACLATAQLETVYANA